MEEKENKKKLEWDEIILYGFICPIVYVAFVGFVNWMFS